MTTTENPTPPVEEGLNIIELKLSFPDFAMGAVMNPDEFDINNKEITDKVNEIVKVIVDRFNSKTLPFPDGCVMESKIANRSVTGTKIMKGTIIAENIEPIFLSEILSGTGSDPALGSIQDKILSMERQYWGSVE